MPISWLRQIYRSDEFYIPLVISKAVEDGHATVKVFENQDKWFGITYREDLAEIKEAIEGIFVMDYMKRL